MHIYVDVHNMLHSVSEYRHVLRRSYDKAVHALIHDLTQYKDWSGDELTLFFDGTAHRDLLNKYGIELVHSNPLETADSLIERRVKQNSDKNVLIITSDHALQNLTFAQGGRFMSPEMFKRMMLSVIQENQKSKGGGYILE